MSYIVDQELCIGCGMCTQLAPDVFDFNDEGKAHVIDQPKDDDTQAEVALDSCPVDAIRND